MTAEPEVKGSTLRSKLAFVRETFGEGAARILDAHLEGQGIRHVLEGSWYPFSVYDSLLRKIADRHYGGDVARLAEIGDYSARLSLTTTYAVFVEQGDFALFLERLATLHRRFYRRGRAIVEARAAGSCIIRLEGRGHYPDTDVYVAQGYYTGAARLFDLVDPTCRFVREGPDAVRFELTWKV